MLAKHNNSVATEETLRFTFRDLAAPILRRKRMMSLTFLFAFSVTLLLAHNGLLYKCYQQSADRPH